MFVGAFPVINLAKMWEDDAESSSSIKKPKIYKQKIRPCWMSGEFSEWLIRSPNNHDAPYCKVCWRKIEGGVCHLRRHSSSSLHKKNFLKYANNPEAAAERNAAKDDAAASSTPKKRKPKKAKDDKSSPTSEHIAIESTSHQHTTYTSIPEGQYIEMQHADIAHMELSDLNAQHAQSISSEGTKELHIHGEPHTIISDHHTTYLQPNVPLSGVVTHVTSGYHTAPLSSETHLQPIPISDDNTLATKGAVSGEMYTFAEGTKVVDGTYLMQVSIVTFY